MQAATIQLNDGETSPSPDQDGPVSNSTPRTWNLGGGITFQVRAFSLNTLTNPDTINAAQTTQFGVGSIGLGVCSTGEDCTFNEWQIDNNGQDEFVLFTFSAPVNIANLVIHQTTQSYDSDTSWYAQTAAATTPSLSWFNQNVVNGPTMNPGDSRTITINANNVQTLLFGAPSNMGNNDYFKLFSIEATAASAPEPGSMALLGSGLIGLGVAARRRAGRK